MVAARSIVTGATILILVACSSVPPKPTAPAWFLSPPICQNCYLGLAEADTYGAAKLRAKMRVCEDLKVKLQADMTVFKEQVRKEQERKGRKSFQMDFREVTTLVETSSAKCSFEGLVFDEIPKPEPIGGRVFVRLVLPMKRWASYLLSRSTAMVIKAPPTAALSISQQQLLEGAMSGCVRKLGYLPNAKGDKLPFRMELVFEPTIQETGTEDLKVARVRPCIRLYNTDSGRIEWEKELGEFISRGFSKPGVINDLIDQARKKFGAVCVE